MPTNRSRTKRGLKTPLTAPERHLLLTGDCWPPKGSWGDVGEDKFRTFYLAPAGRDDLKKLWAENRDELMASWTGKKLPWAAKHFDN